MPRRPIPNEKKFEIVRLWLNERLTFAEIKEKRGGFNIDC
jgi:transposase-like protein